jgi:hypothetical protein
MAMRTPLSLVSHYARHALAGATLAATAGSAALVVPMAAAAQSRPSEEPVFDGDRGPRRTPSAAPEAGDVDIASIERTSLDGLPLSESGFVLLSRADALSIGAGEPVPPGTCPVWLSGLERNRRVAVEIQAYPELADGLEAHHGEPMCLYWVSVHAAPGMQPPRPPPDSSHPPFLGRALLDGAHAVRAATARTQGWRGLSRSPTSALA